MLATTHIHVLTCMHTYHTYKNKKKQEKKKVRKYSGAPGRVQSRRKVDRSWSGLGKQEIGETARWQQTENRASRESKR